MRAFNDTVATYEGRVLVTARRFRDLGAATGDEIGAVNEVDTTPRSPHGVARLFLAPADGDPPTSGEGLSADAPAAIDRTDPADVITPPVSGLKH